MKYTDQQAFFDLFENVFEKQTTLISIEDNTGKKRKIDQVDKIDDIKLCLLVELNS